MADGTETLAPTSEARANTPNINMLPGVRPRAALATAGRSEARDLHRQHTFGLERQQHGSGSGCGIARGTHFRERAPAVLVRDACEQTFALLTWSMRHHCLPCWDAFCELDGDRNGIAGPIELRAHLRERFSIVLSVDQLIDLLRFATGAEGAEGLDYLSFVKHVNGGRAGLLWKALRPHVQHVISNTSMGTAADSMPCTCWHVWAAFDTDRSGWVTAEQLGVGLASLGVPTCDSRLRELCAEANGGGDDDSSSQGFGFAAFCQVLGVDGIDEELDRATRWVGRQAHIWDVVNDALEGSEGDGDGYADPGSPLPTLAEADERQSSEEEKASPAAGNGEAGGGTGRLRPSPLSRQPPERQRYCEVVRSIAARRELMEGYLQALDTRKQA